MSWRPTPCTRQLFEMLFRQILTRFKPWTAQRVWPFPSWPSLPSMTLMDRSFWVVVERQMWSWRTSRYRGRMQDLTVSWTAAVLGVLAIGLAGLAATLAFLFVIQAGRQTTSFVPSRDYPAMILDVESR